MTNVQKRENKPLELLGITYLELPDKNMCCGSAGIYNIVNYIEQSEWDNWGQSICPTGTDALTPCPKKLKSAGFVDTSIIRAFSIDVPMS